jgi:uncharacterized protein
VWVVLYGVVFHRVEIAAGLRHNGAKECCVNVSNEEISMSIQTKANVVSLIHEHQSEIRRLGVKRLGLFGSFVREQQNTDSDVDILVEFEDGRKSFDNFMQIAFLLEDLLGRPVELVTPESLSPYIGPHILHEVEYVPLSA